MKHLRTIALLALTTIAAFAADTTPTSHAAASLEDAFAKGTISFDARLRWEHATQSNLKDSNAETLATRFGFTTAPLHGFTAMLQGENVASLGNPDDYNAAGTNPGGAGRTVIADPTVTDLNQAWLSYAAPGATLKVGRQRIVLDNARFVGDVGWRQNMQTFDAADLTAAPAKDLSFFYGYIWRVSRVFGNKSPQPDFTGNIHLINATYSGLPFGKLTGYAYLLDFDNSAPNSSDTYGASLAGAAPVDAGVKVSYRLEYATQADAGRNPVHYRADYSLFQVGAQVKPFHFGAGYETLGSDHGRKGFATPLATLHAFDGWADLFLVTPADGLRDLFVSAGAAIPGGFPITVVYHDFHSDFGDLSYGSEWDAVVAHKVTKHWTVLAKLARYSAGGPFSNTHKAWLQTEYSF